MPRADWISGASAIGSTAAACIALWYSASANSRAWRAELDKTAILSTRALPVLRAMAGNLGVFLALNEKTGETGPDHAHLDEQRRKFQALAQAERQRIVQADLLDLTALPDHGALSIAMALGYLDSVSVHSADEEYWRTAEGTERQSELDSWAEMFMNAKRLLVSACGACEKVSHVRPV